jgi:hypothetical protein
MLAQNKMITNVDTNYFYPTWMSNNLKVNTFRNGEEIYEAKNISDFINRALNFEPVFIKKESDSGLEYYYNWYAINDPRGIAPIGYTIPTPNDFKRYYNPNKIKFNSIGYIDIEEEIIEYSDNNIYLWTNTATKNLINHSDALFYDANKRIVESANLPFQMGSGLNVRCIEDLGQSIKTKNYNYKLLLPKEYKSIVLNLVSDVRSQHDFKNGDKVVLKGQIGFNRAGYNISSLYNFESIGFTFRKQDDLKSQLNQELLNFNSKPQYKGQVINSETDFNLLLDYQESFSKKKRIDTLDMNKLLVYNYRLIDRAKTFDFKCSVIEKRMTLNEDNKVINEDISKSITSFKSKGPIYALGSVFPGLGLALITSENYNSSSRISFNTKLLLSSFSLGTISLVSKLFSNHFYKNYRNDLFSTKASENYNKANVYHKVFLTSGIGYCILGAIDFTWTISIGVKNKIFQAKLNNQVRNNPLRFEIK